MDKTNIIQLKLRDFESQILYFNGMYKLPVAPAPSIFYEAQHTMKRYNLEAADSRDMITDRLINFKKIISEEIEEVNDIAQSIKLGFKMKDGILVEPKTEYTPMEFLTDMADWLGDIQVYCASEMARYGIPIKETLSIIMSSNFSKLGVDGKPIYDERGKVQKGPGYWKPEPQIQAMLEEKVADYSSSLNEVKPNGIVWR